MTTDEVGPAELPDPNSDVFRQLGRQEGEAKNAPPQFPREGSGSPAANNLPLSGTWAPTDGAGAVRARGEQAPLDLASLTPGQQTQLGIELANKFNDAADPIHPVVIIGAPQTGKTALMVSLLASSSHPDGQTAFQQGDLCRDFFGDTALGKELRKQVNEFIINDVRDFSEKGLLPDATSFPLPFIIPLQWSPEKANLPPVRLALIDSQGEHFTTRVDNRKSEGRVPNGQASHGDERLRRVHQLRDLPIVLEALLARVDHPLTVIYVTPCRTAVGDILETASRAIENGMQQYREWRKPEPKGGDQTLWLLTKWDQTIVAEGDNAYPDRPFFVVEPEAVPALIKRSYKTPWDTFQQSASMYRADSPRHWFMQYTIGRIQRERLADGTEGQRLEPVQDAELAASIRRYTRTVQNFIYLNALSSRGVHVDRSSPQLPAAMKFQLFPDVVQAPVGLFDRLMSAIGIGRT